MGGIFLTFFADYYYLSFFSFHNILILYKIQGFLKYIKKNIIMNNFFKWVKEHVRPYITIRDDDELGLSQDDKDETMRERIEDLEKKAEVGIKFTWKW